MLRDNASIRDIYNSGKIVLKFAKSLSRKDLGLDESNTAGIILHIMIIGEATKRLSSEFRAQHPKIPWKQMAGIRDVIAHQYDEIDFDLMWDVIQVSIPDMLKKIEPLLPDGE